jgi:hypothetical protein
MSWIGHNRIPVAAGRYRAGYRCRQVADGRATLLSAEKQGESMNKGEVYFALYGDVFDPEKVTRLVGIEPTSVTYKGIPRSRKHTKWRLSGGVVENDIVDVYEMASSLVAKLAPHADKINLARERFGLDSTLSVVVTITTDDEKSTPAIGFDKNVIAFLAKVGAWVDVDTYRD